MRQPNRSRWAGQYPPQFWPEKLRHLGRMRNGLDQLRCIAFADSLYAKAPFCGGTALTNGPEDMPSVPDESKGAPGSTPTADLASYAPVLRRYFRKRAPAAEIDDLTQDVFLNLESRRSEAAVEDMGRYLFVVAGHVLARRRRRPDMWASDSDEALDQLRDEITPERILLSREKLGCAMRVIENMSPRTREVFLLHRFEEWTYHRIARELGVSVSAIEKHMMIVLRALQSEVGGRP
jgi:RNA polymerase sigma factor (sigma-70 family)